MAVAPCTSRFTHFCGVAQVDNIGEAVRATASDAEEEIRDMRADETMTRRALKLIASGRNDAYEVAMAALREDTRDWWADVLARDPDELDEGEEPATADAGGLRPFRRRRLI